MARVIRPKQRPKKRGIPAPKRNRKIILPRGMVLHSQSLTDDELVTWNSEYFSREIARESEKA